MYKANTLGHSTEDKGLTTRDFNSPSSATEESNQRTYLSSKFLCGILKSDFISFHKDNVNLL